VPLRFRFLGIFDTVASAGFWSGASALVTNSTGGHGAWASNDAMKTVLDQVIEHIENFQKGTPSNRVA